MPPPSERSHGSIYHRLEQGFEALERVYRRLLFWTLDHRAITVAVALSTLGLAFVFAKNLKSEFFPPTDAGILVAFLETAPGTSLETTLDYVKRDESYLLEQPEIAGLFSSAGSTGRGSIARSNQGMAFGTLVARDERDRSVFEVINQAREAYAPVPGRTIRIFPLGETLSGARGDFEVEIRGNRPLAELDQLADRMIAALDQVNGFVDLDKSLKLGLPELRVTPDRKKAAALGVDARTVATTIQAMVGGIDVGVFKEAGRRYDIRMRLESDDRATPESIGQLYVRNDRGELVELRNLITTGTGAAAAEITRSDRQRSVTVSANLVGITLSEAVARAEDLAKGILPEGVRLTLSGQAKSMQEGQDQFAVALGLAVLVIYMVLAAQFESLVHPLTVMLALPLAMVGALGGLLATGHTINLFSLIGILLLFGLVTKNSILLVDYANQLRREGMDKREAMRTAAPVRMRPVLMTAFSMILGVLPAAAGIGPGAESRAPMAVATAAGMLSSTLLTLVIVPVFYLLFDDAADFVKRLASRLGGSAAQPASSTTP
jgi:multidrug efflux pump subunit AcrB